MNTIPQTFKIKLTAREKEVLSYIARGFSSKQIADRLFISINTVANHRRNMLRKKCAGNSAELVGNDVNNCLI